MHPVNHLQRAPQRRARIWKIVIIAVLIAAIGEPLVMYRVLAMEKEKRQAASGLMFPAVAEKAAVQ